MKRIKIFGKEFVVLRRNEYETMSESCYVAVCRCERNLKDLAHISMYLEEAKKCLRMFNYYKDGLLELDRINGKAMVEIDATSKGLTNLTGEFRFLAAMLRNARCEEA